MSSTKRILSGLLSTAVLCSASSCILAAAGAGAEAGYVASQGSRTAGETIDDQRITSVVKTRLLADPEVSGLDINVDTFKKDVTLRGFVDSSREAERATEIARSVSGVQSVKSTLILK